MRRDFVKYEGDQHRELYAHCVTESTRGEVARVGGPGTVPDVGDYLVQSQNCNLFDVYTADQFAELALTASREQVDYELDTTVEATVDTEEDDYFEPADHTAAEVRAFLERSDVSDENKVRVEVAEASNKNRQTAFPKDYVRTV